MLIKSLLKVLIYNEQIGNTVLDNNNIDNYILVTFEIIVMTTTTTVEYYYLKYKHSVLN